MTPRKSFYVVTTEFYLGLGYILKPKGFDLKTVILLEGTGN